MALTELTKVGGSSLNKLELFSNIYGVASDEIALLDNVTTFSQKYIYDRDNDLFLVSWDSLPDSYKIVSYAANNYGGYDFTLTDDSSEEEGTYEFVSIDIKSLREAGKVSGWGAVGDYNRSTLSGTDSTQSLLKAAEYADSYGVFELDGISPTDTLGYYTSESLSLTNVKRFTSNGNHIYVRSSQWSGDSTDYVLAFGDPDTDYEDLNGDLGYDFIDVFDCDRRSSELNGVFIKKTHLYGGDIRVRYFNGTGLNWAPVYDVAIGHIGVENCGNLTTFAYIAQGNGDETNAVTIAGIVLHNNYHKVLKFSGSKNQLGNIHCEANYVISTDDGTTSLPSGLNYVNYYIALLAGKLNVIDFNDWDSDSTGWDADNLVAADGETAILDEPTSLQLILGAATVDVIHSKNTVVSCQNQTDDSYGTINTLSVNKFYGSDTNRITINSINVDFFNALSANCQVMGGVITELGVCNSALYNVKVTDVVAYQNTLAAVRYNCTFTNGLSIGGASAYASYINCNIGDITFSTVSERAKFYQCIISSFTATLAKDVEFHGGRITGDYTQTFVTYQNIITYGLTVAGTVSGWHLPTLAISNTKTNRLGAESGDGVDYIYLDSDSDAGWVELTTLP